LLLTYNYQNSKIPYHSKVIKKVNKLFKKLHPRFKESNPIISGSYAINLLFKPNAPYKDIDFYFEKEEDFILAADCFFDLNTQKVTANKNCVIYELDGFQYQLITRSFDTPQNIINDHDFYNSAIAIQNDNIYMDKKVLELYSNDLLEFQNVPIYQYETPKEQVSAFATFFNRIVKYTSRYDFELSAPAIDDLLKLKAWVLAKKEDEDYFSIKVFSNLYYNLTFTETESYQLDFNNLVDRFLFFLAPYETNPTDSSMLVEDFMF
tara:strand:+ start:274 stop:1065 length:792 start_codon:yes stop_codon:yes gene_type:complete